MTSNDTGRRRAVRMQRGVLWLTRHWTALVALFFGLYVTLPFAAPVLMHAGAEGPARVIYAIYAPMCHQFAFRSWFLFGDQAVYPREQAGVAGIGSFEEFASQEAAFSAAADISSWSADLQLLSRAFVGNPQMGYKVALCQRDVAIYGTLLLFTLFFSIRHVRDRLRPVSIFLYVLLGLGPIGLDGFSQLLSVAPFDFWPVRESTPLFRTVTGALFGLMNGWLALPYLEESMRQTQAEVRQKLRRIEGAGEPSPSDTAAR